MSVEVGSKAASDLPGRALGRLAGSAGRREPGRSDDAGRRDLPRDAGAVRGGGRGGGRRLRGDPRLPAYERGAILREHQRGIKERREEIGRIIALESGKPIRDALIEVDRAT